MDYKILKQYAFDSDLTGKELAQELGCTPESLSRIINGKVIPRPGLRKKIKEILADYKPYKDQQKQAQKQPQKGVSDQPEGSVHFKTVK